MTTRMLPRLDEQLQHFTALFEGLCHVIDISGQQFAVKQEVGDSCAVGCMSGRCNLLSVCLYGCGEALRREGKYVFRCPGGRMLIAVTGQGSEPGREIGVVLIPFARSQPAQVRETPDAPTFFLSCEQAMHIAGLMECVIRLVAGEPDAVSATGFAAVQAAAVDEEPESGLELQVPQYYPLQEEKALQEYIRTGDGDGAQQALNHLLERLYPACEFDLRLIQIRLVELISILSRTAIDAGASCTKVLQRNTLCVERLQKSRCLEELRLCITSGIMEFTQYVLGTVPGQYSGTVRKAMEYIQSNYDKKISLDDIAGHVCFSRAYLSRVFKEETGENVSVYLNRIRINKAKALLRNHRLKLSHIAVLSGFEDQSYFTKVFKNVTGVSPKQYRERGSGE